MSDEKRCDICHVKIPSWYENNLCNKCWRQLSDTDFDLIEGDA